MLMGFIVLIFILITFFSGKAYSQDTTCGIVWYPPITPTHDDFGAVRLMMAAQGDTVHLSHWYGNYRVPYLRSVNNGLEWEPIRDLITDTVRFRYAGGSFVVTNNQKLYIFFGADSVYGDGDFPIYMIVSTDRGEHWTSPSVTIPLDSYLRSVTIKGDTIALLATIFSMKSERIIFSTDGGANWSVSSDSLSVYEPRIALTDKWLHLVYNRIIEGYAIEVIYKRSSDFGMTWLDSTVLSTPDLNSSLDPVIATQPDGRLYVAWRDAKYGCLAIGCTILLRESTNDGESWNDETIINDKKYGSQAQIAIRDSTIAITWTAELSYLNEFHAMVRESQDYGKTWCPIYDLTPNSIGGGSPAIAMSPSALHTAWVQYEDPFYIVGYRCGDFLKVAVNDLVEEGPKEFSLQQCYPNPFNNSTVIRYTIKEAKEVVIKIYNVLGVEIQTLYQGKQTVGEHELRWDAEKLSTGLYFYRITAGYYTATGKTLLIR
jgi:hypothetical protein